MFRMFLSKSCKGPFDVSIHFLKWLCPSFQKFHFSSCIGVLSVLSDVSFQNSPRSCPSCLRCSIQQPSCLRSDYIGLPNKKAYRHASLVPHGLKNIMPPSGGLLSAWLQYARQSPQSALLENLILLLSWMWLNFGPFPSIWRNFTSYRALPERHTAKSANTFF